MSLRIINALSQRAASCLALAVCATLVSFGSAFSADLGYRDRASLPTFAQADPGTWIVTLTGTVVSTPRYPGASDYSAFVYPSLDIRRAGETRRFSTPDDGFSFSLYDSASLRIGPTARFIAGRYYGDDRAHLFGFRDTRFAVEPGLFIEYYPVSFIRTRFEVRHGVYGHHGFVGSIGADYILPIDKWQFSIGPRFNIGDQAFARKYFGVDAFEAAVNGRVTPYLPDDYYAAGLLGAVTYAPNDTWAYTFYAGYTRILGASADSPLVRRPFGDPNQFTVGVKLDYSFATPAWF